MAIIPNAYEEFDISSQIAYSDMVGNSKDMRNPRTVFGVSNPHPGYMKDPNILNEMGHTLYPKMVYPDGKDNAGQIANSFKHEIELMGEKAGNQLIEKVDDDIAELQAKIDRLNRMKKVINDVQQKQLKEAPAEKTENKHAW